MGKLTSSAFVLNCFVLSPIIIQAVELGSKTLLVDEDTCATNFMIRDAKMMQLVSNEKEPITPFVHFVQSLHSERDISTIIVIGGVGDYFDVAQHVLLMDCYKCQDVTAKAKEIVATSNSPTIPSAVFGGIRERSPVASFYHPNGKVRTTRRGLFSYGETEVDLSLVEQVVSKCQTTAIASFLQAISSQASMGTTLLEVLQKIDKLLDHQGMDALSPGEFHGGFTRPRIFEVGAAVNRLRRSGAITQK